MGVRVERRRTRVPVSAGVGAVGDRGAEEGEEGPDVEIVRWGCRGWEGNVGDGGRSGSTEAGWERERRRSERRVSIWRGKKKQSQ